MNTPLQTLKWNSSPSREVATVARPKWKEIHQGLTLAFGGTTLLLLLGLAGLLLAGPVGARHFPTLSPDAQDFVELGATLALPATLVGYLLVLLGQWRCLLYAPQGHGGKDLLFAGVLCTLTAPVCFGVAHFLGGAGNYVVLRGGGRLVPLELLNAGTVLQLAGLMVTVSSLLLFSGFTRTLARHLRNTDRARSVTCYFWVVAFLLGGTVGMLVDMRRASWSGALPVLALGWLLCLLLHALLIRGALRAVARALRSQRSGVCPTLPAGGRGRETDEERRPGQIALQAASYLSRPR